MHQSAQATNMLALNSIPDVLGADAERRRHTIMKAQSPRSVQSPSAERPLPRPAPPIVGSGADTLRGLKHYMADVASLPRGTPERLQAYRYVFTALIGQLPAHGPLLSEVKAEYDATIENVRTLQPPLRGQKTLHPLQLPTAYYERELLRARKELDRTRVEALTLQRSTRRQRAVVSEVCQRAQLAGTTETEDGLGLAAMAARAREAETEAALELALAGVDGDEENRKRMRALEEAELRTGRMAEAAAAAEAQEEASLQRSTDLAQMGRDLEAELAELRRQMLVLELRVAGSGGQAQLVTQGVKAARAIALQLWEESGQQGTRLKAALDAESVGSALAAERAAAPAGAAVALVPGDDGGDDGDGGGAEAALRLEVAACRELIREAAETEAKRTKSLQVM